MKSILQIIVNLFYWFYTTIFSFFGILWYGKLPKVSMYHRATRPDIISFEDMYNDVNSQVISEDDVPKRVKDKIIDIYINNLFNNEAFKTNVAGIDIPMFDGKDIIGTMGIISVLNDAKNGK